MSGLWGGSCWVQSSLNAAWLTLAFSPGNHSSLSSSTSNIRVAWGGMTPGWPVAPYAMSAVQVIFALCPRLICSTRKKGGNRFLNTCQAKNYSAGVLFLQCWWLTVNHHFIVTRSYFPDIPTCATPSSQPLMTSFRPMVNLKGLFLSREESNFFPFCSVPATNSYNYSLKSRFKQGLLITN